MTFAEIKYCPSPRQLAVFGLVWLVSFAAFGCALWSAGDLVAAGVLWTLAVVIPTAGWVKPALLRMIKDKPNWNTTGIIAHTHLQDPKTYGTKYRFEGYFDYCRRVNRDHWYDCSHSSKQEIEELLTCLQTYPVEIVKIATKYSKGKEPDLEAARACAIWPDAELKDFTKENLEARLPKLLKELKKIVENLGMTY